MTYQILCYDTNLLEKFYIRLRPEIDRELAVNSAWYHNLNKNICKSKFILSEKLPKEKKWG